MSNNHEISTKQTGVLAHLFGVWYPEHYVVGIVEDPATADRAADALRAAWRDAGAPGDAVRLFHAEDAREAIRQTEGSYGSAKRAVAALSRGLGSEEGIADEEYQTAVNEGHNVLAVFAPTPESVERARAALAEFNVRHLRYYGPLAVTDLQTGAQ